MTTLSRSSIRRAAKVAVIHAHQDTGNAAATVHLIGRDLMLIGVNGARPATDAAEDTAAYIITGAIDGSVEAGGDMIMTIRSIVHGTVKGAWEAGADMGRIAVTATQAAVRAATRIGIASDKAMELAVNGAIAAGNEIGAQAAGGVMEALTNSIHWDNTCFQSPDEITGEKGLDYLHG